MNFGIFVLFFFVWFAPSGQILPVTLRLFMGNRKKKTFLKLGLNVHAQGNLLEKKLPCAQNWMISASGVRPSSKPLSFPTSINISHSFCAPFHQFLCGIVSFGSRQPYLRWCAVLRSQTHPILWPVKKRPLAIFAFPSFLRYFPLKSASRTTS